jgi:hypothetical protein
MLPGLDMGSINNGNKRDELDRYQSTPTSDKHDAGKTKT